MNCKVVISLISDFICQQAKTQGNYYILSLRDKFDFTAADLKNHVRGKLEEFLKTRDVGFRAIEKNNYVVDKIETVLFLFTSLAFHLDICIKFIFLESDKTVPCGNSESNHCLLLVYRDMRLVDNKWVEKNAPSASAAQAAPESEESGKTKRKHKRKHEKPEEKPEKKLRKVTCETLSDSSSENEMEKQVHNHVSLEELTRALNNVDREVLSEDEDDNACKYTYQEVLKILQNLLSWLQKLENTFVTPDQNCKYCTVHCFLQANRKSTKKPVGRPVNKK